MKWGTAEADKLEYDCYVQASQTGLSMYLSHGFEILGECVVRPEKDEDEKSEEWRRLEKTLVETLTRMRRPYKG